MNVAHTIIQRYLSGTRSTACVSLRQTEEEAVARFGQESTEITPGVFDFIRQQKYCSVHMGNNGRKYDFLEGEVIIIIFSVLKYFLSEFNVQRNYM